MATMDYSARAAAEAIRAALKAQGWSRRDVSVRAFSFGWSSSLQVRILNPAVPKAAVAAIAKQHEALRRDEGGALLQGGNLYVEVK